MSGNSPLDGRMTSSDTNSSGMMGGRAAALFLFDLTGTMAEPWAEAGYDCYCVDQQHPAGAQRDGNIIRVGADIHRWMPPLGQPIAFVAAFPPCTHLAVSGARWFKGKGLYALADSIALFARAAEICEATGAPYLIENPVSTISSYWRKPDHTFHPHFFTRYEPADNYTKKTCLWTGGGFVMPHRYEADDLGTPDNRIHFASPGDDRANFRSATPRGFARAVFNANAPASRRCAA